MHALIGELLQGIIHKPMFGDPAEPLKNPSTDAHPEMRALAGPVRSGVPCVGCAFIQDLQFKGVELRGELRVEVVSVDVHGSGGLCVGSSV